jgi:hypothetical protein
LGLLHRIENGSPDTFQVALGTQAGVGNGVLCPNVLATSTLQHQIHLEVVLFPFLKVQVRKLESKVVAGISAGYGIDGVGPQERQGCGLGYRVPNLLLEGQSGPTCGMMNVEDRCASILTDGSGAITRQLDVLQDDVQCSPRCGCLGFIRLRAAQGRFHICRQVRSSAPD